MNVSSLTAWLDTIRGPIKPGTTIIYIVPETTTRLVIEVGKDTILPLPMSGLLLRIMNYAATHISKGEGTLEAKEDPFWLDTRAGVIFGLWSTDVRRRLTYRDLASTARGIWSSMYLEGKYNAATISVFDLTYAQGNQRIGYGILRLGHLRPPGSGSSLDLPKMA